MQYNERQIVSIKQACEMVGVCRRTLYYWMNTGKVEWIRTAGKHRRIFADTLFKKQDFLQAS